MLVPSLFKHRPATVWFDYCSKYGERELDADLVPTPSPPSRTESPFGLRLRPPSLRFVVLTPLPH